jgi:hypothetical protein
MTKLALYASTPAEMAASFYVDLRGALIAWSLHTMDASLVVRAVESVTAQSLATLVADRQEGELERTINLALPDGSELGVIFWAQELVEWIAHPGELIRNERAGWRHFLAMCEATAKAAGVPGTIATLTNERVLAVYFPALDRLLACEPFTFDGDTDL